MEWKFLIVVFIFINRSADASLSCKFIDTVNITDGYKDSNQNFVHNGDVYPLGIYQEFDYIENSFNKTKTSVNPHIRGCICKLKPCIRFCCHKNSKDCIPSNKMTISNENEESEVINLSENKYGILIGRSCEKSYHLEPEDYDDDRWNFLNVSLYCNREVCSRISIKWLKDQTLYFCLHRMDQFSRTEQFMTSTTIV